MTAHVSREGVLSAVIATPTELYHVEPSGHYIREPHPFHMIAYSKAHVKERLNQTKFDLAIPPVSLPTLTKSSLLKGQEASPSVSGRLRRQSMNRPGNLGGDSCPMILIADFSAFELFGTIQSAITQLVSHVTHMTIM